MIFQLQDKVLSESRPFIEGAALGHEVLREKHALNA